MGYTFTVGNAKPEFDKGYFPELYARWVVEGMTHEDAPTFINDEMTGNGNDRSPSYSTWSDFCRVVGLYDFFYNEYGHLHAGHPGCIGLTKEDGETVQAALNEYIKRKPLPPGFCSWEWRRGDPTTHDANYARLIWLNYWVQWALANCETPAIQNR